MRLCGAHRGRPCRNASIYWENVARPSLAGLRKPLPSDIYPGPGRHRHHHGHPAECPLGPEIRGGRPAARGDGGEATALRRAAAPAGRRRGRVPVRDAPADRWRVSGHRIRPAERLLCAPPAAIAWILPSASDRRPDVAGDQRSQRRADDDRAGGDVFSQHEPHLRRRDSADAVDQRPADAPVAHPAAARVGRGPLLRGRHSSTVRPHPGAALRPQRGHPGGTGWRAGRARLWSGAVRDRALPGCER